MPTLNWIGKAAVVKHYKDVPFRLLEPVTDLSCGVEKKQIGQLWEKRSNGCAFAWVENRNWSAIRAATARCRGN